MHSRAHYFGNPIHPALITIPIGAYVASVVFDVFYLLDGDDPTWFTIAQYTLMLGIVGALLAAIPGFIDYLFIPRDWSAKVWGLIHAGLNLSATGLAIVSAVIRWGEAPETGSGEMWAARVLSWVAIGVAAISGSIGGHLVYHNNIGNANYPKFHEASLTPQGTEQHKHTKEELASPPDSSSA
ncbi:MAG: DUF2231 domain-containing protein [Dehalococcoidia bacterium]